MQKKHIIWPNAELSRKPDRALDCVVLHELALSDVSAYGSK
jgi:predicted metal-dependent hydrolase